MAQTPILFDPGRMTGGSMYEPRTKDNAGNDFVVKNGPNAGKPAPRFEFMMAIPKKPGEQAWWSTTWGQTVMQVGAQAFPQSYQSPAFSWKVWDGDSTTPNSVGNRPCDNENWRGCWIVKFSSSFAPRLYRLEGSEWKQLTDPNAIKPGYWIQVQGTVDGNNNVQKPGVFVNPSMVAFLAYGPEILQGPNPNEVGFGRNFALPPGASATPLGASMPATPGMPQMGAPAVPGMPGPAAAPGMPQMGAPAVPGMAVAPNPAFLGGPGAAPAMGAAMPMPGAVPMPGVPAAPAVSASTRQMTAKAGGVPYADFIAKGWTDAALIAQGFMLA